MTLLNRLNSKSGFAMLCLSPIALLMSFSPSSVAQSMEAETIDSETIGSPVFSQVTFSLKLNSNQNS